MPRHLLVTGCSGLIGSEAVRYFDRRGDRITGLDNNMRRDFFGPMGDTIWDNRASVLECIALMEEMTGRPMRWRYVPEHRVGDHICYISDMRKFQSHFPKWEITRSLSEICQELIQSQLEVASRL